MGIPKFYRWLSERYPLVNQPVKVAGCPEMDNFYLDMNGIIHTTSHGNDPSKPVSEEVMIPRMFQYLDHLFAMVRPQKLMFMAIDGVAPRAKMNQQRSRRFKSAKERLEAKQAAEAKGEKVSDFDSNCITPGTEFMARLVDHLRFYIRKKIAEDPAWRVPKIVLSGPDVPGEGEHKIMEYIRTQRRLPSWDPNQRHCLYGLDADLIMLSLVTHEPHFCLLREVVQYSRGGRGQPAREVITDPNENHFVVFQLSVLRDYLDLEFRPASPDALPFPYDMERIIDDFVLFCMLVGNDFLPPLPTLDIAEGGLDTIIRIYKERLPIMGGYLTERGKLSRPRLEALLAEFGTLEQQILEERAADAESFAARQQKKRRGGGGAGNAAVQRGKQVLPQGVPTGAPAAPGALPQRAAGVPLSDRFGALAVDDDDNAPSEALAAAGREHSGASGSSAAFSQAIADAETDIPLEPLEPVEEDDDDDDDDDEVADHMQGPTMMAGEARALFLAGRADEALARWKDRFYRDKLGLPDSGPSARRVVQSYIEGLHWVLEYYYRGVASWDWFYPFHYAPCASDMKQLADCHVRFSQGEPFLPFQQLLAVLPPSSAGLLPDAYRALMCSPASPLREFYPEDFAVDYEGKRADYEGVILVAFIDQEKLLREEAKHVKPGMLQEHERARNREGVIFVFEHQEGSTETTYLESTLPRSYGSLPRCNSVVATVPRPPPLAPGEAGFGALCPGVRMRRNAPAGFPTLHTLTFGWERRLGVCNVFGMNSKKESMVLCLKPLSATLGTADVSSAVRALAASPAFATMRVFVRYPYLQEAQVVAISDGMHRYNADGTSSGIDGLERKDWQEGASELARKALTAQGVDTGVVDCLLHVRCCEGLVRNLDGTIEKRFAREETAVPLQLVVRQTQQQADPMPLARAAKMLRFAPNTPVLFLGRAHYGAVAVVLGASSATAAALREGKSVAPGDMRYRVRVFTPATTSAQIAKSARSLLTGVRPQTLPAHQVARKVGLSARAFGSVTSSIWVRTGDGRNDSVDIGLCVKQGKSNMVVPDFCLPDPAGRAGYVYTHALLRALQQYKNTYPGVFDAIETWCNSSDPAPGGKRANLQARDLFPAAADAAAEVHRLHKFLAGLETGKRPMVREDAAVAFADAIRQFQLSLPQGAAAAGGVVEMDEVMPALLLPPVDPASKLLTSLTGGEFCVGDRVVAVGSTGTPPFGRRGTVVGAFETYCEVVFDAPFQGGSNLFGRCTADTGALVGTQLLLSTSRPRAVPVPRHAMPKIVRAAAEAGQAGIVPVDVPAPTQTQKSSGEKISQKVKDIHAAIDMMMAKTGGAVPGNPQPHAPPPPPGAHLLAMLGRDAQQPAPPPAWGGASIGAMEAAQAATARARATNPEFVAAREMAAAEADMEASVAAPGPGATGRAVGSLDAMYASIQQQQEAQARARAQAQRAQQAEVTEKSFWEMMTAAGGPKK
ncbi:unnamed protein product [Pedinophyceae sp. YPF-701]|nr:unnamed protein product [Pedinophyceae sp. YPF-701]